MLAEEFEKHQLQQTKVTFGTTRAGENAVESMGEEYHWVLRLLLQMSLQFQFHDGDVEKNAQEDPASVCA